MTVRSVNWEKLILNYIEDYKGISTTRIAVMEKV